MYYCNLFIYLHEIDYILLSFLSQLNLVTNGDLGTVQTVVVPSASQCCQGSSASWATERWTSSGNTDLLLKSIKCSPATEHITDSTHGDHILIYMSGPLSLYIVYSAFTLADCIHSITQPWVAYYLIPSVCVFQRNTQEMMG